MLSALIALCGGLFRLAPEFFKLLNKKTDYAHELEMMDKQIAADTLRSQQQLEIVQTQGDIAIDTAGLAAFQEAQKAQSTMTGVKWVDGLSQLMRPILTIWWAIILETLVLIAKFVTLHHAPNVSPADALLMIWGPTELGFVGGIMNFWFLDRVFRKNDEDAKG